MKYIIMSDGRMSRWQKGTTLKHLLPIGSETVLERLVRQLREQSPSPEPEIIITSHNPAYEVAGARRYEPQNNVYEIDRFTWELIDDEVCFLYGDTVYSDQAVQRILSLEGEPLCFVADRHSIVAVKVFDAGVMRSNIAHVREAYRSGLISDCRGWQVYLSYVGLPLDQVRLAGHITVLNHETFGFNTPDEYAQFIEQYGGKFTHGYI